MDNKILIIKDEAEIRRSRELGAVDYLLKADYHLEEIVAVIKKYMT